MEYRPEIDGLRALAVVSVVACHAKLSAFSGGFVGVDIFFVISGFLISSIIYREVTQGRFSIVNFYERRIRRIAPALIFVMAVSFIPAHLLMLPDYYEKFSQSVVATTLCSNNLLLTLTSGYWDLESDFKPMLHTWSLGVEEQFYIIFPLLAVWVLKAKRNLYPALLLGILSFSLVLCVALSAVQPNATFYLLHTRAWELALGALAAYYIPQKASLSQRNLLSLLGGGMILASIFCFREKMLYPSYFAAIPCVGTALTLGFGTKDTLWAKLASLKAIVFVGLMSYSIYLWHQPIFAFYRIFSTEEPRIWNNLALILLTLVCAYFSWRYVEVPFRDRGRFSRTTVFTSAAIASVLLVVIGAGVYLDSGIPERVPGLGLSHGRSRAYNERVFQYQKNEFASNDNFRILVVGNSTARDFVNVMLESSLFSECDIVYREDIDFLAKAGTANSTHRNLLESAEAIVVVASWYIGHSDPIDDSVYSSKKPVVYVGPKHFGYNINAYMRLSVEERAKVRVKLMEQTIESNENFAKIVPASRFVNLIAMLESRYGGIPLFNEHGELLTTDRVHLTKAGAVMFSEFVFTHPVWSSTLGLIEGKTTPQVSSIGN